MFKSEKGRIMTKTGQKNAGLKQRLGWDIEEFWGGSVKVI